MLTQAAPFENADKHFMKRLHLIRHAKSSWSSGSLADIDRPLNQRGLKSCVLMAPQIVKAGCSFEHVFCSPAVRAQSTLENLAWEVNEAASKQGRAPIDNRDDEATQEEHHHRDIT